MTSQDYGLGQSAVDMVGSLDWLDRIEGFASSFRHADWKGAYQEAGVRGVVGEFFATLAATNRVRIQFRRFTGFDGGQVELLLRRYGVDVWGRGFTPGPNSTLWFSVKRRQARWADYLLRRWGVPVVSPPPDPRNPEYVERHEPESLPSAWADGGGPSPFQRVPDGDPRARLVAERGQQAEEGVFAVLDGVVESDWQERVFDWMSD